MPGFGSVVVVAAAPEPKWGSVRLLGSGSSVFGARPTSISFCASISDAVCAVTRKPA